MDEHQALEIEFIKISDDYKKIKFENDKLVRHDIHRCVHSRHIISDQSIADPGPATGRYV